MSFEEAALYQISRWEFWQWVISTFITVCSIFGAAFWAQHIFNENARKRENRERRLKVIETLIETTTGLNATWNKMKLTKVSIDMSDLAITLVSHIIKIRALADTYELEILESLNAFQDALDEQWEFYSRGEGSNLKNKHPNKIYNDILPKEIIRSQNSKIRSIIDSLKASHRNIEKGL